MTDDLLDWIIGLIKKDELIKFYKSIYWRRVRDERQRLDNYECQECKKKGKVKTQALLNVHHIKEVKKCPELALDLSNTQLICVDCHNELHDRKWKKEKEWNDERW